MQHTIFFFLGWVFAALKVLVTVIGLALKHKRLERSALFKVIYVASKASPPLFMMCFIADAALMHDTEMIRVYIGLLLLIGLLLVLASRKAQSRNAHD